jgi:hypothetical protein
MTSSTWQEMIHTVSEEAINRAVRRTRKALPLGPDARCWKCGCADPTVLHRRGTKIWCYECSSAQPGKTTVEEHHLVGKANDPELTAGVPGNLHLPLTDAQTDWPRAVRYNPERDPLLWLAALCLSLRDIARELVGRLEAIAQFLVQLSRALQELLGTRWWVDLGLDLFWMGGPSA